MQSGIVDTDGVLRNFEGQLRTIFKRYYPDLSPKPITDRWKLEEIYPIGREIYNFIYKEHPEEIFLGASPYAGAKDFIAKLKKKYYIILASSQPNKLAEEYTTIWYKKHKFEYDKLIYVDEKWKIGGEFIIEDSPIQLDLAFEHKTYKEVIPFVQPWNLEWYMDKRKELIDKVQSKNIGNFRDYVTLLTTTDNYRIILNYFGLGKKLKKEVTLEKIRNNK